MDYKRKVRFVYFEVIARQIEESPNTPDMKFDFRKWIAVAEKFSLEGRTYDYYAEQARLDRIKYESSNNYWFLSFLRMRETNIPSTARIDKEAEPIMLDDDEYIGEEAISIYDFSMGVLMLQRNKFSLSPNGLEMYINLVWKDRENIRLYLRPIIRQDMLSIALRPGNNYRRLTVRFADIKEGNFKPTKGVGFNKFFDILKSYDAINAEITITVGNRKNTNLSSETVKDSLEELVTNKEVITKAEVGIKYDDEPVEILDLFSNTIHDFIIFNMDKKTSLASEHAMLQMIEKYKIRRSDIATVLRLE